MNSPISVPNRKQTASFRITGSMFAIALLWLMLAANSSAHAQTSSPSPADWTQFHRDNMQRWNPYETVLGVGNVDSLQLKWKNPIGQYGLVDNSSPAVANGVVYIGNDDGDLYALKTSTGAFLWSYVTGGPVTSSPAVASGVVYVGSEDGNLYALNATTGVKLWSYTTGSPINSSPAVANGVVYFGSNNGNLYALEADSGARLWNYTTGNIVFSSPAVANGMVYVGSEDGNLYALNATTGTKLWSFDTGVAVQGSPTVANGAVYISSNSAHMYALNASTGGKLWTYAAGGSVFSSAAEANGVVYFGSEDGALYALNASTGAKLWSSTVGGGVYCSPAVANGVVYFGADEGNVYALNAGTGAKLWSYQTLFGQFSSPAIVDGVVYVSAGDLAPPGSVFAFGLGSADLFLRVQPSTTTVHQGDLLTFAFPVWNLGPGNAVHEGLNTQVPAGTTFDYIRISGTPGLGTCTTPPYQGTGQIVCHENAAMAPNTTWTVRLTVKVTASAGTVITANAAIMSDTPDPNMANNMATVSVKVQ